MHWKENPDEEERWGGIRHGCDALVAGVGRLRREYSGPGINQPPLTIKIPPDAVNDVTRTPVADDSTSTNIEPTEPVTSDVSPTGPVNFRPEHGGNDSSDRER